MAITLFDALFPDAASAGEAPEMYARASSNAEIGDDGRAGLRLRSLDAEAATLSFDAWYNALPLDAWQNHAALEGLFLRLRLAGQGHIEVFSVSSANEERLLLEQPFSSAELTDVRLPIPRTDAPLVAWRLRSQDCLIQGARYESDTPEERLNPVRISIIICTYKREAYVHNTLDAIEKAVRQAPALGGSVRVRVVDNGRGLEALARENVDVRLYPNPNNGGSGGFGRGMLETLEDADFASTHVLLMDDDIELPDGVLYKTWAMLRLLRPERATTCIGGAMLDLRRKHMHFASVECTDGFFFLRRVIASDLDMRRRENLLALAEQRECPQQHQAWWYCVMPVSLVREHGLPYPFFFQYDDLEYSLRTQPRVVHLPGIFVRHEPFHAKEDNAKYFFIFRNQLILGELYPEKRLAIYRLLARTLCSQALCFNYAIFRILRLALEAFLQGPERLVLPGAGERDLLAARQHDERLVDISAQAARASTANMTLFRKILCAVSLNGHLLPDFCLADCGLIGLSGKLAELGNIYLKKTLCRVHGALPHGSVRQCSLPSLLQEACAAVPPLFRYLLARKDAGQRYRDRHRAMTAWKSATSLSKPSALIACTPPRPLSVHAKNGMPSVCFVVNTLYPGGAERQLVHLAVRLQQRGVRVRVRALDLDGPNGHYAPFLAEHKVDVAPVSNSVSRCLFPLLRHRLPARLWQCLPGSGIRKTMHLAGELLRDPADVAHAYLDLANFVTAWAGLLAGVPLLRLSFRSVNPSRYWFYEPWMRQSYQLLAGHPRISLEANSRHGAEDYAAWLDLDPARIVVSPNGIAPDWGRDGTGAAGLALRAALGIPADALMCLCVCRLDAVKRPLDMLAVFERIVAAMPEAHCLHAGIGPMEGEIIARRQAMGTDATRRIHLLGARRDMPTLYAASDLVLLCSEVESMPNAVLEAMLMGVPVVSARVGGCPELITEGVTGFMREAGDVEGLANAVLHLLRETSLREAMGRAGRERVREFSLDALADRALAAYRHELARPQGYAREPEPPSWVNLPLNCLNVLALLRRRVKEARAA